MTTGDKVLALLGAKAVCCGLLVLAATGALGGIGVWLTDGAGRWLMGGAILVAIVAIVFRRRYRIARSTSAPQWTLVTSNTLRVQDSQSRHRRSGIISSCDGLDGVWPLDSGDAGFPSVSAQQPQRIGDHQQGGAEIGRNRTP